MDQEVDALSKNYGFFLSKQDRFEDACRVLEGTAQKYRADGKNDDDTATNHDPCIREVYQLWKYCQSRIP